jgi:F0F1-type ATP synthase membrane subunit a
VKLVQFPAATTVIEVGAGLAVLVFVVWSVVGLRNRRMPAAADAA